MRLAKQGFRRWKAVSFANPKDVPQFRDVAEVLKEIKR